MKCIHLSVFVLLMSAAFAGYGASTYYVSPTGRASGATGTEDDPFPTIQDGLNVATNRNDAVIVADGTYVISEPLSSATLSLKLKSASGNREAVVVDAQNQCAVLSLTGTYVTLSGMTFKNGRSTDVGVLLSGNGSVVSNVHVTGCVRTSTVAANGGGLCLGSTYCTIVDSVIDNCSLLSGNPPESTTTLELRGGGLWLGVGGSAIRTVVSNCCLRGYSDQTTYPLSGGGIFGLSCTIEDCEVYDCIVTNTANLVQNPGSKQRGGLGGGMYVRRYSDLNPSVVVRNCVISGNQASYQAAGMNAYGSETLVENCYFSNNSLKPIQTGVSGAGSALCMTDGSGVIVRNCRFKDNEIVNTVASTSGGTVAFMGATASGLMHDCVIEKNIGRQCAGVTVTGCGAVTVSNCVIRNNHCVGQNAAVFAYNADGALVTDCWIEDNKGSGFGVVGYGQYSLTPESDPALTFRNCLIRGNCHETGVTTETSGFYWWVTKPQFVANMMLENCTIVSNLVESSNSYAVRGRAVAAGMSNVFARASVVWGNGSTGKLNFKDNLSTLPGHVQYTYTTGNVSEDPADGNIVSTDDPGFVDAANGDYRPVSDKCALAGKVPYSDWMGDRKTKDLGDGTYVIAAKGKYGVTVTRNKPVRRSYDNLADIGCFEFPRPSGLMLLFR